jgi:hypothetical protein
MATRIIDDTPIIANFFFPALEPSLLIAIFFNEVINVLSTKLIKTLNIMDPRYAYIYIHIYRYFTAAIYHKNRGFSAS